MRGKPDLQAVLTCLSRLEGQIADQRRLVDVLRQLGDVPEAEKAALRLTSLEESFDAVFLYRKLLEEEMSRQKRSH